MRPIIDAHLDLAWNALYFDRDLLASAAEIRRAEKGMTDEPSRGGAIVSLPELRRAGVRLCVATILARSGPAVPLRAAFKRTDLDYKNSCAAHAHAMGQLAYYRWLESQRRIRIVETRFALQSHWQDCQRNHRSAPLGVIVSMEGADPVTRPDEIHLWKERGLRALGLTHYGHGQYACGTGVEGPLTACGRELLKEMAAAKMILDVTHLSDESFSQALESYSGPILASHQNCRALAPDQRQLSDEQIRLLIERGAVIGLALDAWMLVPGWRRGESRRDIVSLGIAANHLDRVCQIAGNARHCGIGSDLDGGFGNEQTPIDVNNYSDLHALETILAARGWRSFDIDAVFHGNWLRFFSEWLP